MDIRSFAVAQTAVLHLRDANDELMYATGADGQPDIDKPMRAHLYGPGSKRFAAAQTRKNNKLIDKMKAKGKTRATAEEEAAENAEFLAAVTHSLENVDYDQLTGEALFAAVYADRSLGFIAEQVAKYLGDWANFSKGSASN